MAVTITILLMRHGLSCSNVLDGCTTRHMQVDNAFQPETFDAIDRELMNTPFDRAVGYSAAEKRGADCDLVLERPDQTTARVRLHDAYRDPKLTDCGVEMSKRAGVALRRRYASPALVLSSTLQRARETAQNAYPEADVFEAPFLTERAPSQPEIQLDNEPRAWDGASLVPEHVARNASDWAQFLAFFGETIAPRAASVAASEVGPPLADRLDAADDGGAVVFLAGHGDFLQEVCGLDAKPANNAVLRRRVVISDGVLREEPGPCELILRGVTAFAKIDVSLDADDVARCMDPFPVAHFLEFGEASTCRSPWAKAFTFPDEDPPPPKPWYGEL